MKKKLPMLLVFVCCVVALLISLQLFWNMGVYVDEYGTSPDVVCGGEGWLYADWLRLALLGIASFVSGLKLFAD